MYLQPVPPLANWYDIATVVALLSSLVAFVLYWFLAKSERVKSHFFGNLPIAQNANFIIFTKYFGFVVMGILPLLLLEFIMPNGFWYHFHPGLHFSLKSVWDILLWTACLGIPVGVVAYLSSRNAEVQANYPEIRTENWTKKLAISYAASWFFYLLGYEVMFRGVLFLGLTWLCGFWTALALNLVIYCAIHIPKGMGEAIGALFLGFFLCLATWQTQSIWAAFFVHLILSWTTNYFAWKYGAIEKKLS